MAKVKVDVNMDDGTNCHGIFNILCIKAPDNYDGRDEVTYDYTYTNKEEVLKHKMIISSLISFLNRVDTELDQVNDTFNTLQKEKK